MIDLQNIEQNLKDIQKNLYTPHECPLCNAFNSIAVARELKNNLNGDSSLVSMEFLEKLYSS